VTDDKALARWGIVTDNAATADQNTKNKDSAA
jgi:hypothetical protein